MMQKSFISEPGFCPDCGSILPELRTDGGVTCFTCKRKHGPEVFGEMVTRYVINFNSHTNNPQIKSSNWKHKSIKEEEPEGPLVERKCPQCNNDVMSYSTLQLRSADEGQTIFYTCTKCKFKETENS
ncbi:DNA-directed RNA polymerase I subunit RPA12 [Anabrus simplex]|uniref:DNA-directed RNA polymerase I subunit RPA12 n=1 Tax=Anabrus simplex TaxID=316456 RepID=UPI0035A2749D